MLYKNAEIFTPSGYIHGYFTVEDGRFAEICSGDTAKEGIDLNGAKVIPGLVELHSHGCMGADFSDGDYNGLVVMARYYASRGITSFAPASMTLPYDILSTAFATAVKLRKEKPEGCAVLRGIHMEGPYFSEKKKGAQNADYLKLPDIDGFTRLYNDCEGLIRIADVAPELKGAKEFAKAVSKLCRVSVAHTDATYEEAAAVFNSGATHLTHLFNAMPSIHHRKPGVIGAASEKESVTAELICDGLHVHPSSVRMAFKLFPERICLVSDSLRCCGMPDGEYFLAGQEVFLSGGIAKLADGTIAGSATNLFKCMQNAILFGIPEDTAIRAATIIPARELGCDAEVGSIEVGKQADFLVCEANLNLRKVYIAGNALR